MLYLLEQQALATLRENQHLAPNTAERLAAVGDGALNARAASAAIEGDVATINVEGVLTPKPDLFARMFLGANTTYSDIRQQLRSAKADPRVSHAVLNVSSPGGTVDGLFETLEDIKAFKAAGKTMSVVSNFACSAAYAIAAVAGNIDAVGDWAMFGSVGVAASYFVNDKVVDITSTDAPQKRPDLKTAEGKAVVRKELDDIHALFVRYIAEGRGLPTSANFGKGGVVLAQEARRMKLIDSIGGGVKRSATGATAGGHMSKALELIALMGAKASGHQLDEAEGRDPADIVADYVCGPAVGRREAASERSEDEHDDADVVASIVCGSRRPDLSHLENITVNDKSDSKGTDTRTPAEIVADAVCGVGG